MNRLLDYRLSNMNFSNQTWNMLLDKSFWQKHGLNKKLRGEAIQAQDFVKNGIVDTMDNVYRELLRGNLANNDLVLYGCRKTDRLCAALEAMFLHGLRHTDNPEKELWKLMSECCPADVTNTFNSRKSDIAKCRAFIKDMVNAVGIPVGLNNMLADNKCVGRKVDSLYLSYALIKDMDRRNHLIARLDDLQQMFEFRLRTDHPSLQSWCRIAQDLLLLEPANVAVVAANPTGTQDISKKADVLTRTLAITPVCPKPIAQDLSKKAEVLTGTLLGVTFVYPTDQDLPKEAEVPSGTLANTQLCLTTQESSGDVLTSIPAEYCSVIIETNKGTEKEVIAEMTSAMVENAISSHGDQHSDKAEFPIICHHLRGDQVQGDEGDDDGGEADCVSSHGDQHSDKAEFPIICHHLRGDQVQGDDGDDDGGEADCVSSHGDQHSDKAEFPIICHHLRGDQVQGDDGDDDGGEADCVSSHGDQHSDKAEFPIICHHLRDDQVQGDDGDDDGREADCVSADDDEAVKRAELSRQQFENSVAKLRRTLQEMEARNSALTGDSHGEEQRQREEGKRKDDESKEHSTGKDAPQPMPAQKRSLLSSVVEKVLSMVKKVSVKDTKDTKVLDERRETFLDNYTGHYSMSVTPEPKDSTECVVCQEKLVEGKHRVCHLSGQKCCRKCHSNKKTFLPSKVISEFDFKKYPVCDVAFDFLKEIETRVWLDDFCWQPCKETTFSARTSTTISLRTQLVGNYWRSDGCPNVPVCEKQQWLLSVTPATAPQITRFSMQEMVLVKVDKLNKCLRKTLDAQLKHLQKCSCHQEKLAGDAHTDLQGS